MKKVIALSTLALSLFAGSEIVASKVKADLSAVKANADIWKDAEFATVKIYPQTAVFMNDEQANELNAKDVAKSVKVGVLYNDKQVAFKMVWDDATKSVQKLDSTDSFGDGFALQLPTDIKSADSLPYIGMGDENHHVLVYLNKAIEAMGAPDANGNIELTLPPKSVNLYEGELKSFEAKKKEALSSVYSKAFIAKGFGSTTEIKDKNYNYATDMSYEGGKWSGVVVRDIKDVYSDMSSKGAYVAAFAAWDGEKQNRDGVKLLSSWQVVKFVDKGDKLGLANINKPVSGDAAKGQEVAMQQCASCHRFQGAEAAPKFMAPGLYNIGGYATTEYIEESIVKPNAVVVPGYNANAHSAFAWSMEQDGKLISTMPAFDWLDKDSLTNLVAYLKTLKQEDK